MPRRIPLAIAVALLAGSPARAADGPAKGAVLPLDDFEGEPKGWKFVGGEEFPGAKGGLNLDPTRARGGKASYRLDADFGGGGAYVGAWKDLAGSGLPDVSEFRVWVQSRGLDRVGVRVVDETGQCHQKTVDLPIGSGRGWRELTFKVADLAGGEHWGGANDGAWHGSPKGLGLNIGKVAGGGPATLWVDDLEAVAVPPGLPTLRAGSIAPASCRPGYGTRISYEWDAEPLGANASVFVHFVDEQGRMAFQGDHEPPTPTARWSGRVAYARSAATPTGLAPGRYDVVVGLWDPRPSEKGGGRRPFRVGPGLTALPDDACRVGTLEVSADAPLPTLPPPSLKLDGYRMTFDEDFRGPLSVSARGPGTRWIAHTPYGGDFGDAGFGDPGEGSPFSVRDGILAIEARKVGGKWRSGLLCSVDPEGRGFSQQYGYFEIRAKFPGGLGTWPAFWLMGVPQLVEPKDRKTLTQVEIDVVEQYGVGPNALHTTLHLWGPGDFHWAEGDTAIVTGMTEGFHTYGVLVEPDFITFYYDGSELRRSPTPKEARVPLYLMVDLALGGGWPIEKTPDPSRLLVDYIRAYAKAAGQGQGQGRKPMPATASGPFDVKITPQAPAEGSGDPTVGRMAIDKTFRGDLEATSKGEMLATRTPVEGSAGYVAIERVTGKLHGRQGSFSLQHTGTMTRGVPELSVTVIPDSATGELAGLAGKMTIKIDGQHSYVFEYTLPGAD